MVKDPGGTGEVDTGQVRGLEDDISHKTTGSGNKVNDAVGETRLLKDLHQKIVGEDRG